MTLAEMGLTATIALIGGGNVWNWLTSRGKQKVDLITLGQTISEEIIKALKEERADLIRKVEDLQQSIDDLIEHIDRLEGVLIKAGIKPPPRPAKKHDTSK